MNPSSYLASQNLYCKSQDHLSIILPDILDQLKQYGYCIVQMWDLTETPLIALRNRLGQGQQHIRADQNGVVAIAPDAVLDPNLDHSQYFGTTSQKHPPHTDGAYLKGFLKQQNTFKRIGPPAIVLIQCVRAAIRGGTNIVIDTQEILKDLLAEVPYVAKTLFKPGCVSFCRDNHMVLDVPVFEKLSDHWRVRFRCDEALYISDWAYEAVRCFYTDYLLNENYRHPINLEEGQILILDNFRVLHGREAFTVAKEHNRFFRRTWVQDDSDSQVLVNFCNSYKNSRTFERYSSYSTVGQQPTKFSHLLNLGIHLPHHLSVIANEHESYLQRAA